VSRVKKFGERTEGKTTYAIAVECGLIVIRTAGNPDPTPDHRRFAATESLFFASSETGLSTVLLITDSSLRFSLSRD
jgi:hypothetical protein